MSSSQLLNRFPWAKSPLISNAPMLGIATPLMAAEVTKAGGLGILTPTYVIHTILSWPDIQQQDSSPRWPTLNQTRSTSIDLLATLMKPGNFSKPISLLMGHSVSELAS